MTFVMPPIRVPPFPAEWKPYKWPEHFIQPFIEFVFGPGGGPWDTIYTVPNDHQFFIGSVELGIENTAAAVDLTELCHLDKDGTTRKHRLMGLPIAANYVAHDHISFPLSHYMREGELLATNRLVPATNQSWGSILGWLGRRRIE